MSTWTHAAGIIRIDDYNAIGGGRGVDLSTVFKRDTWYNPSKDGTTNLPKGSEGSLDVEIIERKEDDTSEYMKTVAIFGDLRDFDKEQAESIKEWWKTIPFRLKRGCAIREAVIRVYPEDGEAFVLTEMDMEEKSSELELN